LRLAASPVHTYPQSWTIAVYNGWNAVFYQSAAIYAAGVLCWNFRIDPARGSDLNQQKISIVSIPGLPLAPQFFPY
jgi:hypothetical protein